MRLPTPTRTVAMVGGQVTTARVLASSGVVRPYAPRTLVRIGRTLHDWGLGAAGGYAALTVRNPDGVGLVDEVGPLTHREIDRRGSALAASLRELGVGPESGVAVLCRNHRGVVDATLAAAKLGADVLYLNTAFAAPQLADVLARERPAAVVHDQELGPLLEETPADVRRVVAWVDDPASVEGVPTVEELVARGPGAGLPPPVRRSRAVLLTSGTTGVPRGAPRQQPGLAAAVTLLSRLPLRRGWTCHVAAPLFHTWGWAHLTLATLLETTVVVRRRFDPEDCLRTVAEHECRSLVAVPVMLHRILQLPDEVLDRYDLSRLEVVAVSGSALPGDLGTRWMDRFGDTLYSVYGSTEVGYATVATPEDLRESPGTAGRPPRGTTVRVVDERGRRVPDGTTGRIVVGNDMLFAGYSDGGTRDRVDGLMTTGDLGHIDVAGRLTVEGREDEMIVSGGENVFPAEVEHALLRHPAVVEAACVGVDDEEFGQRLVAFVVLAEGRRVGEDELARHVGTMLARYKVPREVVVLDALPRNETGKVLKRELPRRGSP